MSIVPPFTWEAIMGLGKVDELIHVLGLAREEARRSVTVSVTRADRGSKDIVREIVTPPDFHQVNGDLDTFTARPNMLRDRLGDVAGTGHLAVADHGRSEHAVAAGNDEVGELGR